VGTKPAADEAVLADDLVPDANVWSPTMNVKSWIPLVVAAVLGLIALVVAKKALSKTGGPNGSTPLVAVAVAARDLPPGQKLTPEDLAVTRLPAEMMPAGSFRSAQDPVGRITRDPLAKGQAVIETALTPTGTLGGITGQIKPGFRAMTLEVNEFTGLAGMLQPGSKVDVIAVLRDEKSQQPAARTILQRVEVKAVGRNFNAAPPAGPDAGPPAPPSNNITLMVTPRQAQILQLATQNGRPWLVLRNNLDADEPEAELTTLAELRNQADRIGGAPATQPTPAPVVLAADPFAAPKAKPAARVVQVIRGGVETTVTFQPADPANPAAGQGNPAAGPQPTVATPVAAPATQPDRLVPNTDGRIVTDVSDGLRPE
jgi:pilus assembly protein CpaB